MTPQVSPPLSEQVEVTAPVEANDRARRFWSRVTATYELQPQHLEVLRGICLQMTRADEAAELVARLGVCVPNRYGAIQENPAVGIERKARAEIRAGVHALNLEDVAEGDW
jgi:hypothetical protein